MDYSQYSVKEFVLDDSFQQWVLQNDLRSRAFWEAWLAHHPEKADEVEEAKRLLLALADQQDVSTGQDAQTVWQQIQDSLDQAPAERKPVIPLKRWYYVAATLTLLMLVGIVAYLSVRPLASPQRAYTTDFGQTRKVLLPDSTRVTLNANSTLYVSDHWQAPNQEREVWLEGEGFFEVRQRNGQKFIVHTEHLAVEVLGTSFDVRERRGNTQVVLNTGRVSLHVPRKQPVTMKPGERVLYTSSNDQVDKQTVDPNRYIAWKNNLLVFDESTVGEIAALLEDNYGFEVSIANKAIAQRQFNGTIPAQEIDLLLEAIAEAHGIRVWRENNTIRFTPY